MANQEYFAGSASFPPHPAGPPPPYQESPHPPPPPTPEIVRPPSQHQPWQHLYGGQYHPSQHYWHSQRPHNYPTPVRSTPRGGPSGLAFADGISSSSSLLLRTLNSYSLILKYAARCVVNVSLLSASNTAQLNLDIVFGLKDVADLARQDEDDAVVFENN
ncbi:MAG: hypothetical protein LQ345_005551 [Seirophora villosa]|nr:MAG: hypothetical protein LQ345_005551 [Seirophora villosa]